MARKPKGVRWERAGRTEAKHAILKDYLDAWIPILGTQADDLVLIDGFAGPGRYTDGSPGSPLIMLDAYLRRRDRPKLGVRMHYFFIEHDVRRHAALERELSKRKLDPDEVEVQAICGSYEEELPRILDDVATRLGRPPVFVFIDPFGAEENRLDLATRVLELPRCELLMFIPLGHFARFVESPDLEDTLDALYGTPKWRRARKIANLTERRRFMQSLLREQLKGICDWVRSFEMQRGSNRNFLFFGTNNKKGLARMKEAMWRRDPVGGQTFRDATAPDQPVLFEVEPDLRRLREALQERFADKPFTIEQAQCFTLTETPFRHDKHLKGPTLAELERGGEIEVLGSSRNRRFSYPEGTRMRFTRPS